MTRTDSRLVLALIVSLLLHLMPLVRELIAQIPTPPPPSPPPMAAQLRPLPTPQQAPLNLPEPARPRAATAKPAQPEKKITAAGKPGNWQTEVRRQFKKLDERDLFYPADAIAQGQEGEVLVLLILDQAGNSVAARLEQSSGYPSLDSAALRAARSLRSLPADAPRETLIPVRFKLY